VIRELSLSLSPALHVLCVTDDDCEQISTPNARAIGESSNAITTARRAPDRRSGAGLASTGAGSRALFCTLARHLAAALWARATA
jgi:hypothetical protein